MFLSLEKILYLVDFISGHAILGVVDPAGGRIFFLGYVRRE
jgi:hypothetical protein